MKKVFSIMLVALSVLFVAGCGSDSVNMESNADNEIPIVNQSVVTHVGFNIEEINSVDGAVFSLTPHSAGVVGDGFLVTYQGENYFLPEGQVLDLSNDRRYRLGISRAFKTDRAGMVLSNDGQFLDINPDKQEMSGDEFHLQVFGENSIAGWIQTPRIIADFEVGNIVVATHHYMGPPQVIDDVIVTFDAFVRMSLPSIEVQGTPQLEDGRISFKLPSDTAYTYASVSSRVFDSLNNRVIVSEPAFIEFEH